MVITFDAHAAVTPAGRPVAVPIEVAPVVVCVILVSVVLVQSVGVEEAAPTVLFGETVTVAETLFAEAQAPLVRIALYEVVAVRFVAVKVVVVLAMVVPAVEKLFKDDSQRVIAPV